MTTPKLSIAFPEVAQIRKGGAKVKNDKGIEVVGKDLNDRFRVVFYPGVAADIQAAFYRTYDTYTPHRIRAMTPFRSVWEAWSWANEAHNAGRMVAKADDEKYIVLRDPLSGEYIVRDGEPHRPYTPGEVVTYERNGKQYSLKLKSTSRLRLFLPEIGRLVTFQLKTTSYYDRLNIGEQLGAIQAIADALNAGNAAGIPFYVYRAEREVTWNKPDGGALRVKKWLINIEADPAWVETAVKRMSDFALTGAMRVPLVPQLTAEIAGQVDPNVDEDDLDDEIGLSAQAGGGEVIEGAAVDVPATTSTPSQPAPIPAQAAADPLLPKSPKDWTTFWSVSVPGLNVPREKAQAVLKAANLDALEAYQALKGG